MTGRGCRLALLSAGLLAWAGSGANFVSAQVFTVGEKSATADIDTTFKPTHVEIPDDPMTELAERELMRNFAEDQGFARRALPLGTTITLEANGNLRPAGDEYRKLIYSKGQAAAQGDRVAVTGLRFQQDRILIDLNGGPHAKHRFLQHVQVGIGDMMPNPQPMTTATGMRIALVFEGGTPALNAPQLQALLAPLIDFKAKTGEVVYAETLPPVIRDAIASHQVLVGMTPRMVLASLGEPESKVREGTGDQRYEEWIYGHQPQTIRFVRFVGDRVTKVEIAAMGKAIDVHDRDEMDGYAPPDQTHTVDVADGPVVGDGSTAKAAPPSLRKPGEASVGEMPQGSERRVQFPDQKPQAGSPVPASAPPGSAPPPAEPAPAPQ